MRAGCLLKTGIIYDSSFLFVLVKSVSKFAKFFIMLLSTVLSNLLFIYGIKNDNMEIESEYFK